MTLFRLRLIYKLHIVFKELENIYVFDICIQSTLKVLTGN